MPEHDRPGWVRFDTRVLENLGVVGWSPTPDELARSPIMDHWIVVIVGPEDRPSLAGLVTGHPTLPDGKCVTSNLLAADIIGGWVRTRNRFYRLGRHNREAVQ